MILKKRAYARAGLMGNPSDGYFGKTISFTFTDFYAEVTLFESPELKIEMSQQDHSIFGSIEELVKDVTQNGYYGGVRLLKATVKRFHDYCSQQGIKLPPRNFTVRYASTIPRQVGLAGSSAIITACLRCLMDFYGVRIPIHIQPNLILSVETKELGISAGLQDRVVQVYEGLVYMDFSRNLMEARGYGEYERLDVSSLPNLFIAYRTDLSEVSEKVHNRIRERFEAGDPAVLSAMKDFADYAERARACLLDKNFEELGRLMDANFDRRASIFNISERNLDMVMRGRSVGANVKFTGSGGAVVGMYRDGKMFEELKKVYEEGGYAILKPTINLPSARA